MSEPRTFWFDIFKWSWIVIFLPLFLWIHHFFILRGIHKRRREAFISLLESLPDESKAKLIQFYEQGSQTIRLIRGSEALRLLVKEGVLAQESGGTHDADDGNYTIAPHVWEIMDDWVARDGHRFIRK